MAIQALVPPKLTENALKVLEKRYLKRDSNGMPLETVQDLFLRVAQNIAQVDLKYEPKAQIKAIEDDFYGLMAGLEFLPNSPTLMNAGRDLQQLSACFVLPVEDSIDGIYAAIRNAAVIHKSGGGTGFSFSRLRPHNDLVRSTSGVASGPVSFMKVFNSSTEAIKQGGTRRGANMAILRVDHPDILEFISCKRDTKELTNFNISIAVTDIFMKAVEEGSSYELIHPNSKQVIKSLNAREVFDMIVHNAWETGEPGIVFIDRINAANPTPQLGEIESTNPCGEQPLLPYEACNLGSINLSLMVKVQDDTLAIDYTRLRRVVHSAVHFLDNVIEASVFPLPQIDKLVKTNRKIGLGVMGFADLLLKFGVPYNSEKALHLADNIMKFIDNESKQASRDLAKTRGAFPAFAESIYARRGDAPLRNATTTTIAPTGSISILAGASSGIEPIFAISYIRTVMDKDQLFEVNPEFQRMATKRGFYSDELMREIAGRGSVQGLEVVPEDVQSIFVTAHDISPIWHTRMQSAFQKYTDNAVSKTVNFRHDAKEEDVALVYKEAFGLGCKGVTVYRDGSRQGQVLSTMPDSQENGKHEPRQKPAVIHGYTEWCKSGCGELAITLNQDERGLFEVYTHMGKTGGCYAAQSEALARVISLALRAGVSTEALIKNLRGIRCSKPAMQRGGQVLSCPDAIGISMDRYLRKKNGDGEEMLLAKTLTALDTMTGACPDCGGTMEHESGCAVCRSCGFSRCG